MAKKRTKPSAYEVLLKELKERGFEQSHILAMTPLMVKMAATWRQVRRSVSEEPQGESPILHPAWNYVSLEDADWCAMTGAPMSDVVAAFSVMARLDMIYPDGTCPETVADYLLFQANELIGRETEHGNG